MAAGRDEALGINLDQLSRWVLVIGVPIIACLLVNTVRRVRAIQALDAKLRAEAETKPLDPYAELARLQQHDKR